MSKRSKKEKAKVPNVVEKVKAKMQSMVKSRAWLNMYDCLYVHVKIIRERVEAGVPGFTKVPKLSKDMSLEQLQELYDEIHTDKYGHL